MFGPTQHFGLRLIAIKLFSMSIENLKKKALFFAKHFEKESVFLAKETLFETVFAFGSLGIIFIYIKAYGP